MFVVLDDLGFGQLGCYGSPVATPNIDALAAGGLRYTSMQTTALCSPTRSCVLTGRNHHSNHVACITEGASGFPGYDGNIPFENGFLSEILLQHGYNTYALGKWHLTPVDQQSAAGPYDRWPLGRGFERFYGFLGGETHQYYPALVQDNTQVRTPRSPRQGYTLNQDLADRAIACVADAKQVDPDKPFFLYYCPGAMHAPHQVPRPWADQYAGAFDDGWEAYRERVFGRQRELSIVPADAELSRHDPDVPHWASCSAEERRLYARMMEVYAGFLTETDHHIGRVINALDEMGELATTLIMLISDNGASAEGGPHGSVNENLFFNNVPESLAENMAALDRLGSPETYNHYAWGWAWAGDTPFRRWKRETYRGGTSDPLIVHWPAGIASRNERRSQYVHVVDMVPTVLEALGIQAPPMIRGVAQSPIEGVSFAHTFDSAEAPTRHRTQYFEMMGHRAIYHDGWRAVCPWPGPSFAEAGVGFGTEISYETFTELDARDWELYHVERDLAENHNVAAEHPAKLIELIAQWYLEAGRYTVLPVDGRGVARIAEQRVELAASRTRYTYYPNTQDVPAFAAVAVLNRPHSITALVDVPDGGAEGVLLAHGGVDGGYALYLAAGRVTWCHNYVGREYYYVRAPEPVGAGEHELRFEFEASSPPDVAKGRGSAGRAQLYVDRELVAQAEVPVTTPLALGLASGLRCGAAPGSPVCPELSPGFDFTGTIRTVVVDVSGELIADDEAAVRRLLAVQ